MMDDLYPCGCDGCDREALSPDEYCVTCHHYGCSYEARCP